MVTYPCYQNLCKYHKLSVTILLKHHDPIDSNSLSVTVEPLKRIVNFIHCRLIWPQVKIIHSEVPCSQPFTLHVQVFICLSQGTDKGELLFNQSVDYDTLPQIFHKGSPIWDSSQTDRMVADVIYEECPPEMWMVLCLDGQCFGKYVELVWCSGYIVLQHCALTNPPGF